MIKLLKYILNKYINILLKNTLYNLDLFKTNVIYAYNNKRTTLYHLICLIKHAIVFNVLVFILNFKFFIFKFKKTFKSVPYFFKLFYFFSKLFDYLQKSSTSFHYFLISISIFFNLFKNLYNLFCNLLKLFFKLIQSFYKFTLLFTKWLLFWLLEFFKKILNSYIKLVFKLSKFILRRLKILFMASSVFLLKLLLKISLNLALKTTKWLNFLIFWLLKWLVLLPIFWLLKRNYYFRYYYYIYGDTIYNFILEAEFSKQFFKKTYLIIEPKFLKKYQIVRKFLYWLLYEKIIYEYVLGGILLFSYYMFHKQGINFTDREDILDSYYGRYTDIRDFIIWLADVNWEKELVKNFVEKYKPYSLNIFVWIFKKLLRKIFVLLLYIYFIAKKRFLYSLFFFFSFFLILKFVKIVFLFIFLNFLKFKIFSIPLHLLFNYSWKLRRRFGNFFRRFDIRVFRYFTLKWWAFFYSRSYVRYFRKCRFRFRYKRKLRGEVTIHYSYLELWTLFLFDNFIWKFMKRWYKRLYYRRQMLYKMSIRFKHKFGLRSKLSVFIAMIRLSLFLSIRAFFYFIYIITYVILYILDKIFYIIEKILKNVGK